MTLQNRTPTHNKIDWYSDLVQTEIGTGRIHTVGVNNFQATGTLTATVDGHTYPQPANGT
ncbi:hypothetical protein SBI_09624 [Streptomyces bingchenggensis BCW-1]|uniref:Uncharacterized protein n=1 Tax=Streptomyces bingchenggensis (strain BCW-1) TaxID=749414 RepID=D7C9N0_STRBB|nr:MULTISPECIES: hypothetical protein [Streptomyces]ADI12742.1 hypothetical protein SBI_09624 [Streptomyces bingchenggensis BCW-1]